jgi:hypothetical protein
MSVPCAPEVSPGQAIFGNTPLGDRRRTARLVETFDRMRRHPGGTLADKLAAPADLTRKHDQRPRYWLPTTCRC